MTAFNEAWNFLKALDEQQLYKPNFFSRASLAMGGPAMSRGQRLKTMHPAIQGLMDRKFPLHSKLENPSIITNTPKIERENVEAWPKGYDPEADAEYQLMDRYEQEQRQKQQEREEAF